MKKRLGLVVALLIGTFQCIVCDDVQVALPQGSDVRSKVHKKNVVQMHEQDSVLPRYIFEFTGGTLWPTNRTLQKIHGRHWPTLQVKGSFAFAPGENSMFPLYGWAAVSYTAKDGRSIGSNERTNIKITPLSVGLRTIKAIDSHGIALLNFGVGVQACFVHIENRSTFVPMDIHKVAPAGIVNLGLYIRPYDYVVLSGVLDYNFGTVGKVCFGNTNVVSTPLKIDHAALRIGLGVTF